ncbi:hypothetical protein HELRODRAFT_114796 [Helobdella robusta]|uniref:ApaG domain-containing protein n=1 Tax=Helobdella robusta TaxID=6412 RepID=T1EG45_HELRO|nr:hypothetical protein HELRODRAFT_114796 [Helobdella robusta]ESN95240.1 hypothetical protein HELRODRAFT_114796 [Helobdella robusta]
MAAKLTTGLIFKALFLKNQEVRFVSLAYKLPIRRYATKLAEVGVLETPKSQGKYETGQLFLHKVFGYRGVVLFPWIGKIYDRDLAFKDEKSSSTSSFTINKDVKAKILTYYQVLMDTRDSPHVRVGTETVTFLSNQDNNSTLYSIPGLDYIAHEDILPYKTSDEQPIKNHLFQKFFSSAVKNGVLMARESLQDWQSKNYAWLELTDIHRETTKNIRVTVMPFYIGSRAPVQSKRVRSRARRRRSLNRGDLSREVQQTRVYWWRYCIRIENLGDESVQLRERHWRIFSLSGTLETVRGRGIVGQEPVFTKSQPAFQYTSHVSLQAPSGHMWGTFKMEKSDGSSFECRVPPFSLESKPEDNSSTPHAFLT